jgi:hypothetical protein
MVVMVPESIRVEEEEAAAEEEEEEEEEAAFLGFVSRLD